jgi:aromatic ring-opening dioxygenase catalytic subunit (LigB family)
MLRRGVGFNNYVKANLQWQGPDDQHPLVNYLAHEGGSLSNSILSEPISMPSTGVEIASTPSHAPSTYNSGRKCRWHGENTPYPWAESFNNYVKANLQWQGPDDQHPPA